MTTETVRSAQRRRYRLLVLCSANQCRSPIGERIWRQHLLERNVHCILRSGGVDAIDGKPATELACQAMFHRGVDLRPHRSRGLGPYVQLADLIVTMTNAHVREVVAYNQSLWSRTFPLIDLMRRSEDQPRNESEPLSTWLGRVGSTRLRRELLFDGGPDDVADPTGEAIGDHHALVGELDRCFGLLTSHAFGHENGLGRP